MAYYAYLQTNHPSLLVGEGAERRKSNMFRISNFKPSRRTLVLAGATILATGASLYLNGEEEAVAEVVEVVETSTEPIRDLIESATNMEVL